MDCRGLLRLVWCRTSPVLLACGCLVAAARGQSPPPSVTVNGFKVTYTGGTCKYREIGSTIDETFGYGLRSDGTYGGGGGNASSVDCSGTIKATFEWKGEGPAPTVVVIEETSIAGAENRFGDGSYDNGLGSGSGVDAASQPIPHFVVKTNPQYPFSVECTPSASASGPDSSASVSYAATPTPVSLTLHNTVEKSGGSLNCMIGTAVVGELNAGSYTKSNYAWTVSGDKFASFSATMSAGHPVAFDTAQLTTATPAWRWKELADGPSNEHPETVTCTATLTSGAYTVGTVTVTQPVSVWTPYVLYRMHVQGRSAGPGKAYFDSSTSPSQVGVETPTGEYFGIEVRMGSPAFAGVGKCQFVQTVNLTYKNYSVLSPIPSVSTSNGWALDRSYPYQPEADADATSSDPVDPLTGDQLPTTVFTDVPYSGFIAGERAFDHQFDAKLYVMFKPLTAGDWCTTALCDWNWHADDSSPWSIPSGQEVVSSSLERTSFPPSTDHPSWTKVLVL